MAHGELYNSYNATREMSIQFSYTTMTTNNGRHADESHSIKQQPHQRDAHMNVYAYKDQPAFPGGFKPGLTSNLYRRAPDGNRTHNLAAQRSDALPTEPTNPPM